MLVTIHLPARELIIRKLQVRKNDEGYFSSYALLL